ncbi:hypothetical protein COO60DRAFT_1519856 [Scenedesmus sp. NREL 46B-D3]|nr:hypothetical protein COO60DRAFT_1519856 [Scenedesmus sp. NREL 46B-D3]
MAACRCWLCKLHCRLGSVILVAWRCLQCRAMPVSRDVHSWFFPSTYIADVVSAVHAAQNVLLTRVTIARLFWVRRSTHLARGCAAGMMLDDQLGGLSTLTVACCVRCAV